MRDEQINFKEERESLMAVGETAQASCLDIEDQISALQDHLTQISRRSIPPGLHLEIKDATEAQDWRRMRR